MDYLVENYGFGKAWFAIVLVNLLRYIFFAGAAYLGFYVIFKKDLLRFKIQQRFPKSKKMWSDIKYSLSTILIFGGIAVAVFQFKEAGVTQIYAEISEFGWGYFTLSLVLIFTIEETYFYWVHRFMHIKGVYEIVHKVHHQSHNPSPFTAFAFHPLEAVLEAAVVFIFIFLIPIHPLALVLFAFQSILMNVLGHTGYEFYPKKFTSHWLGKWKNTPTHHNMHHQFVHGGNYSLFFNFWDRVMGTNYKNYDARFEEVKQRTKDMKEEQYSQSVIRAV